MKGKACNHEKKESPKFERKEEKAMKAAAKKPALPPFMAKKAGRGR